jgi:hypothetical protein
MGELMLVVGVISVFLMLTYIEMPIEEMAEIDITCPLIETEKEDVDDSSTPRIMVDDDFEHDVYDHMRDPSIEFPPAHTCAEKTEIKLD